MKEITEEADEMDGGMDCSDKEIDDDDNMDGRDARKIPDVNFNIHPVKKIYKDDSDLEIICPIRKETREDVIKHQEKAREQMVSKYERKKGSKRLATFKLEDHVSIEIPKKIRKKTDAKRLPCLVVDKTRGNPETYKLVISGIFFYAVFF